MKDPNVNLCNKHMIHVRCPTLIVWGDSDELVHPCGAQNLADGKLNPLLFGLQGNSYWQWSTHISSIRNWTERCCDHPRSRPFCHRWKTGGIGQAYSEVHFDSTLLIWILSRHSLSFRQDMACCVGEFVEYFLLMLLYDWWIISLLKQFSANSYVTDEGKWYSSSEIVILLTHGILQRFRLIKSLCSRDKH